jgi:hypothetical protein
MAAAIRTARRYIFFIVYFSYSLVSFPESSRPAYP